MEIFLFFFGIGAVLAIPIVILFAIGLIAGINSPDPEGCGCVTALVGAPLLVLFTVSDVARNVAGAVLLCIAVGIVLVGIKRLPVYAPVAARIVSLILILMLLYLIHAAFVDGLVLEMSLLFALMFGVAAFLFLRARSRPEPQPEIPSESEPIIPR